MTARVNVHKKQIANLQQQHNKAAQAVVSAKHNMIVVTTAFQYSDGDGIGNSYCCHSSSKVRGMTSALLQ